MAEFFEVFLIVFKAGFEVITKDSDLDMAGFIRSNTRFGTHVTDRLDAVHDAIELFCFGRETERLVRLRPRSSCQRFAFMRQMLPEVFRDEWHERMEQCQHAGQGVHEDILGDFSIRIVLAIETALRRFDVPVTEIVPCEVVDAVCRFTEFILVKVRAYIVFGVGETVEDPLVGQRQLFLGRDEILVIVIQVHQGELGRIPELVGEVSISFDTFIVETHIIARGVAGHQGEAERICAVLFDDFKRIDAVAEGFGHLAALRVADKAVDEYVFEWDLLHEFHGHEHHAGYPEEDDVVAGDHGGGRIPLLQRRCLIRPAHRGEWPKRRGEPGIEYVRILMDMVAMALRAFRQVGAGRRDSAAVIAVPDRDTMPPPKLAGNAPVMDVRQPLDICFRETFRDELGLAGGNSFHSRTGKRFHLDEPLLGGHRFDDGLAAGAVTDRMLRFFDLDEKTGFLEISNDGFSRFVAIHADILACLFIHRAIFVHDDDGLELMSLPDLKVIRVMRRCDLYAAGTISHVNVFIGNDRDLTACAGKCDLLADEILVAFIFRIHSDSGIARDGFRTGGRDLDVFSLFASDRVIEVPEMSDFIFMFDFDVGECCLAARAPVRDAEALIDQAFFIEGNENLTNGTRTDIIHGEAFTGPVAGRAEAADLQTDAVAEFFLPLPYTFQEFFTAEVIFIETFFSDLLFDLDLRCDAGMIFARQPQDIVALHSLVTDQNILQGIVERMPHVQLAGDIWRRQHDAVRFFFRICFIMEYTMIFPEAIPFLFDLTGIVFSQIFHVFCHIVHSYNKKISFIHIGRKSASAVPPK